MSSTAVHPVLGLISDTHGHLDPRACQVFEERGVTHILHAGDIGALRILYELEAIAPVTAVRGNNDLTLNGWPLEDLVVETYAGKKVALTHDMNKVHLRPEWDVLVCGHTHSPLAVPEARTGVLIVNPGAISNPRRGSNPSVAILSFDEKGNVQVDSVDLERWEELKVL